MRRGLIGRGTITVASIAAVIAALGVAALPGVAAALFAGLAALAAAIACALLTAFEARRRAALSAGPEQPREALPVPLLDALIAPLPDGVFLLDEHLVVLAANAATERITGRPRSMSVGRSLIRGTFDADLLRIAREHTGQPVSLAHADGRELMVVAAPMEAPPVREVLVLQDRSALARAVRARTDLVANVSHELRTPVAAARAVAETLQEGVDDPEAYQRFMGRLVVELERLGAIVERLLHLSRIESGAVQAELGDVEPHDLLETAALRIGPLARQRGITLQVEGEAEQLPPVRADRERSLEVLVNLLDNAIRFSPEGETVHLRAEPSDDAIRFEVRDHGPGILPSERERVFERFFTSDRSRGPGGGTGLGLAIARHLVEQQGGRIWVADRTPGATLCFTLPLAAMPLDDTVEAASA